MHEREKAVAQRICGGPLGSANWHGSARERGPRLSSDFAGVARPGAAVSRTVVDDPEHAASVVVRRPGQYLLDEAVKKLNAILRFAAAKDPGVMNIQTGNVRPRPAAKVLVLDLHDAPGARSKLPLAARIDVCAQQNSRA